MRLGQSFLRKLLQSRWLSRLLSGLLKFIVGGSARQVARNGGGLVDNDGRFAAGKHYASVHATPAPRLAMRCIAGTSHCRVRLPMGGLPSGLSSCSRSVAMMPYASERPPDAQPCTPVQGVSDNQGCQPLGAGWPVRWVAARDTHAPRHGTNPPRNTTNAPLTPHHSASFAGGTSNISPNFTSTR